MMKIIVAPAKQMKYTPTTIKMTKPVFLSKQKKLKTLLRTYSSTQIHDIMKVSFKLADEVYSYYHQPQDSYPAIHYYSGTVFKQLKLQNYQTKEADYLSSYVRILSAYWGVLSPYDGITKYRLDMTMKLDSISLYPYWERVISKYFSDEDCIISLASKEFTSMVAHPNIITIDFVEDKAGKLVRNAMYVKKARGQMLDLLVKQKITTPEAIKDITFDNYYYHEDLSTTSNWVFYRTPDRSYQ